MLEWDAEGGADFRSNQKYEYFFTKKFYGLLVAELLNTSGKIYILYLCVLSRLRGEEVF